MVLVVIGAAGAGKTTVGRALAAALGWRFVEGDDLHSPAHVEQMRQGIPLSDEDRAPWLQRVRDAIEESIRSRTPTVVACSALRRRYRELLGHGLPSVRFVFLDADATVLRARLESRTGHFMPAALLPSQLATLERPRADEALTVDATAPVAAQIEAIRGTFKV
jgi:carbohydrate kinase (thermoresistant glucokinase family)